MPSTTNQKIIVRSQLLHITSIDEHAESIHGAFSIPYGIAAWFKAYLSSDVFTALATEARGETFDTYAELYEYLAIVVDNEPLQNEMPVSQRRERDSFFSLVADNHRLGLNKCIKKSGGITDWFKSYILSKDFLKLDDILKGAIISTHSGMCIYLTEIFGYKN